MIAVCMMGTNVATNAQRDSTDYHMTIAKLTFAFALVALCLKRTPGTSTRMDGCLVQWTSKKFAKVVHMDMNYKTITHV
jgi:hypothetical protein